jgi:DNA-binding MarR family transcriptional regulator
MLGQNETAPKRSRGGAVDLAMTVTLSAAQALQLWHDVNLDLVRSDEPDLSTRQITLLLTVYLEAPPHTVRDLARKLGVSKPVITRALDSLGRLELLTRRRDQADRRNVLVQRTVKGVLYLERLAGTVGKLAKQV